MRKRRALNVPSQLQDVLPLDPARRVAEIRHLLKSRIELTVAVLAVELLDQEVKLYCGESFARKAPGDLGYRGGTAPGSILWQGQRVPIRRPRVRADSREVPLKTYEALRDIEAISQEISALLLGGVSTRDYAGVIDRIAQAVPLAKSSVSQAIRTATGKHLELINGRDLSGYRFVAVFLDGIQFAGTTVLVGLGVTDQGQKVVLGLMLGASENAQVCKDLLANLIERGLRLACERVLVVIDGAKALKKAVEATWADQAVVARCRVHKMRNVLEYLPKSAHAEARRRMRAAWSQHEYGSAKAEMHKVVAWLQTINESAAGSLKEGLEEILTVHRLGLPEILRKSFGSTNLIESPFALVRERTRRVKNWRRGPDTIQRWAAAGLLDAEKRMNKIRGHAQLPLLLSALGELDTRKKVA